MDMGTRSLSSFGGMCYYAVIVRGALAVKRGLVAAGYQELSLSMCDVLRRRSRIEAGVMAWAKSILPLIHIYS